MAGPGGTVPSPEPEDDPGIHCEAGAGSRADCRAKPDAVGLAFRSPLGATVSLLDGHAIVGVLAPLRQLAVGIPTVAWAIERMSSPQKA